MNKFWIDFVKYVGFDHSIPDDIIKILNFCGYDNLISLSQIDLEEIKEIERFINNGNLFILSDTKYVDLNPFLFSPGHQKLLKKLAQISKNFELSKQCGNDKTEVSFIMKELLDSAEFNMNIPKQQHRYTQAIQWFSTYIYMMSGKAAYEILRSNLPLPTESTIRKLNMISTQKTNI